MICIFSLLPMLFFTLCGGAKENDTVVQSNLINNFLLVSFQSIIFIIRSHQSTPQGTVQGPRLRHHVPTGAQLQPPDGSGPGAGHQLYRRFGNCSNTSI